MKRLAVALLAVLVATAAAKAEPVSGSVTVQPVVVAPGATVTPKVLVFGELSAKQSLSVRVFCTSLQEVVLDQTGAPGDSFTMGDWESRAACEVLLVLHTQKGQTVTQSTIGHDSFTVMSTDLF